MLRFQIKSRALTAALVAAVVIAAALPAAAAAATVPITFDLQIGFYCVEGTSTPGSTVEMTWKDSDGNRKARRSLTATSGGQWQHCNAHGNVVEIGDSIRVNDGTTSRLFVVPELTITINRVTDVIKGRGPANQYVRLLCEYTNGFEPCQTTWRIRVSSEGKWSFRNGWDFVGWQSMAMRWRSPENDFVWAGGIHGPYVDATIGSAIVRGATRAGGIATVVLRRAGSGDVVGTAVTRADPRGDFITKFRNNQGNTVKVRAGDRITSDVAADEDWIVPNVPAHAYAASDIVTGQCPEHTMFVRAIVMRDGYEDGDWDWPEEDDSFELDLSSPDIQPGETVRVSCYTLPLGDWSGRAIVAN